MRTCGTVDDVQHVGAEPRYVVTSVKGIVYTFAEDCLRSKGATDPVFALQGSELVTINLTTAGTSQADSPPSHHHVVLMLDTVPEVDDDDFADAEAGQDVADKEAADAVSELASAQSSVMATFEARLQQRDEDVQGKLQEQLAAITMKQEQAYERMLLTLSAHTNTIDGRAMREQQPTLQPTAAASTPVDINPRLVSPVADDFTTPAPREIPIQDLMTSPLQALRSGSLAMASTQRRSSFKKIFDLNSSGGTTASEEAYLQQPSGASKSSPAPAATDKSDESYVAEYYARAQLANAKMVRQYKTRIDELQKSSLTSIAHYFRLAMHSGGKVVGYLARRLSWAEIMLIRSQGNNDNLFCSTSESRHTMHASKHQCTHAN